MIARELAYQEAIDHFNNSKEYFNGYTQEMHKIAIEVLEKQIPKKPNIHDMGLYCPTCHSPIDNRYGSHCDSCGQRIDRS